MLTGPVLSPVSGIIRKIVIFLHGYGATGDDLIDIGAQWAKHLPDTLFVSPHAPDVCEMSPLGYQWFGLQDFNPLNIRQGMDSAAPIITHYIKNLMAEHKLEAKDIALVGFSQGSMLAMDMVFQISGLGGIVGYSGAFYPPALLDRPKDSPPILLVHGTADTVVPYAALLHAQTQLQLYGVKVTPQTCNGLGHSIDDLGLRVGREYLYKALFQGTSVQNQDARKTV
ncbi:MAG: dienelactone hydrolase family protein [Pseudomonadota bacterium]